MHNIRKQAEKNKSNKMKYVALLQTLNKAAATLQRSAHNEQEFFRVFRELVTSLGFKGSSIRIISAHTQVIVQPDQTA